MPDHKYKAALKRLRSARLILTKDPAAPLDCHPLIREHFAAVMRKTAPDAFRDGHSRLYEHYCKQAPEQPDTLEQMTPLFYAVYHGCQADRHPEVRRDVYRERILHGNEVYLIHKLGASGTSLSQLANFFQSPWTAPIPSLSSADQAWVISESAFALRALGRLADAVDPMRAAAGARVKQASWRNAAVNYGNLSVVGEVKAHAATGGDAEDFIEVVVGAAGEESERHVSPERRRYSTAWLR